MQTMTFAILAALLLGEAGTSMENPAFIRLKWDQDPSPPADSFQLHWKAEGEKESKIIELGKLKPKNKTSTFDVRLASSEWLPGQKVCFQVVAYQHDRPNMKSGPSNAACKTIPKASGQSKTKDLEKAL